MRHIGSILWTLATSKVFRHEIFLVDSVPTNTNSSTFDLEELEKVEHKGVHHKIIDHQKPTYEHWSYNKSVSSWNICDFFQEIQVPTNINLSINHQVINSNTFNLEELSQSDNEILELNLDKLLQETNNSAPDNTNTITMSSFTFRWRQLKCNIRGQNRKKQPLSIA